MRLVRGIERQLERLIESPARVFGGGLSDSELEARLFRAGDLALMTGPTGPTAPNHYELTLHPRDIRSLPNDASRKLAAAVERNAAERGWRLDGPGKVTLRADPTASKGTIGWSTFTVRGEVAPWARLVSSDRTIQIRYNRSLIGRDPDCDLVIPHRQVSRDHALIWREGGSTLIEDRGSTNGTFVDGYGVPRPTVLRPEVTITLGPVSFVFEPL
ncbi:MAG: FhaA domain-containing protein [Acidimicrobiia bacterium]